MKQTIALLVVAVLISGCATVNWQSLTSINRQNLLRLSLGMTKSEALSVMGTDTKTVTVRLYKYRTWASASPVEKIIINNPYKNETLRGKDDKSFEVIYYVTDDKNQDGAVSDDELTPLVFDNGKLIGWGWSFLQDNVQKYELRMR